MDTLAAQPFSPVSLALNTWGGNYFEQRDEMDYSLTAHLLRLAESSPSGEELNV